MAGSIVFKALRLSKDLLIASTGSHVVVDHLLSPLDVETALKQVMLALTVTIAFLLPNPPTVGDDYRLLLECLAFHTCFGQVMNTLFPADNVYDLLHQPSVSAFDRLVLCVVSTPFFAVGRRVAVTFWKTAPFYLRLAARHIATLSTASHRYLTAFLAKVPGYLSTMSAVAYRTFALLVGRALDYVTFFVFQIVPTAWRLATSLIANIAFGTKYVLSLACSKVISVCQSMAGFSTSMVLSVFRTTNSALHVLLSSAITVVQRIVATAIASADWSWYLTKGVSLSIASFAKTTMVWAASLTKFATLRMTTSAKATVFLATSGVKAVFIWIVSSTTASARMGCACLAHIYRTIILQTSKAVLVSCRSLSWAATSSINAAVKGLITARNGVLSAVSHASSWPSSFIRQISPVFRVHKLSTTSAPAPGTTLIRSTNTSSFIRIFLLYFTVIVVAIFAYDAFMHGIRGRSEKKVRTQTTECAKTSASKARRTLQTDNDSEDSEKFKVVDKSLSDTRTSRSQATAEVVKEARVVVSEDVELSIGSRLKSRPIIQGPLGFTTRNIPRRQRSMRADTVIQQYEMRTRERTRLVNELVESCEADVAAIEKSSTFSSKATLFAAALYALSSASLDMKAATEKLDHARRMHESSWHKCRQEFGDPKGRKVFSKLYEDDIDLVSFLDLEPSPKLDDAPILALPNTPDGQMDLDSELMSSCFVEEDEWSREMQYKRPAHLKGSIWGKPGTDSRSHTHGKTQSMAMRRELVRTGAKFFIY